MQVICGLNKLKNKMPIITMGVFDGVHKGHQKVINYAIKRARQANAQCMVVTFDLHPKNIISNSRQVYLLTHIKQKERILKNMGVDVMLIMNFNRKTMSMSPQSFVKNILYKKIGCKEVIIGYNFNFGCQRAGNVQVLKKEAGKYNIKVTIIPGVKFGNILVSSTKIRNMLKLGEMKKANRLLGQNYRIEGVVIKGKGRGRKWDIPTANLSCSKDVILPEGVFLVNIVYKNKYYRGLANIGYRPTLDHEENKKNIEVYIMRFNENIYGERLEIELIKKIRSEKRFLKEKELTKQIAMDIRRAEIFFAKHKIPDK